MKQNIINFIRYSVGIAVGAVLLVGIAHAWTAPTVAPTGGNTPAPLNTSTIQQTKPGILGVQTLIAAAGGVISQGEISGPKGHFGCPTQNSGIFGCDLNPPFDTANDTFNALLSGVGLRVDANGKTTVGAGTLSNGNFSGIVSDPDGATSIGSRTAWHLLGIMLQNGTTRINGPLALTNTGGAGDAVAGSILTNDGNGNAAWVAPAATTNQLAIQIVEAQGTEAGITAWCKPNMYLISGGGYCSGNTGRFANGNRDAISESAPVATGNSVAPDAPGSSDAYAGGYTGWDIECAQKPDGATIHTHSYAFALCAPLPGYVASAPTVNPQWYSLVATGEPVRVAPNDSTDTAITGGTYQHVPAPATNGESCLTWMAGPLATPAPTKVRSQLEVGKIPHPNSYSVGHAEGDCAYQFDTRVAAASTYFHNDSTVGGGVQLNPGESSNEERNNGQGGLVGTTATCQDLPATFARADAKPVPHCLDTNAVNAITGNNTSMEIWTDFFGQ